MERHRGAWKKAKRFTAASTPFHIKHHFTPVTHVALSFPSPPTGEHHGYRGHLVWLIVPACRLRVWQHEGTSFGCCAGVSGNRSWVQGLWERGWATEEVLVLRGGRATETQAGSVAGSCGASGGVLGLHVGGARDEVGPWWVACHPRWFWTRKLFRGKRARASMWDRPTGEGYTEREPWHRRKGVEEDNPAGNWRPCIRQHRHACPQQRPPYWCHRGCQLVPWFAWVFSGSLRRVAGFNCGRRGEKFEMEYGSHERSTWRGSCSFPFIVRARGIAGSHVRMAALG